MAWKRPAGGRGKANNGKGKTTANNCGKTDEGILECPECKAPMVPMSTGKGFRCSKSGRWLAGQRKWSGCNGAVWNNSKPFFGARERAPRASAWPVIEKPTEQQRNVRAHLGLAPAARGGRCTVIDAGPGTGKTATIAWSLEAIYNRLGSLANFPQCAFNVNARDVFASRTPAQVPEVATLNGWGAQSQGYKFAQFEQAKLRRIFKSRVEHIPWDNRPNAGMIPKLIERMRDICLYNPDPADFSWWQGAINATLDRFPSLTKTYTVESENVREYLPAVATLALAESGTIDIQEQVTRPVSEACARTGWRMPFDLPCKRAADWTDEEVSHFAKLVRAIRLPQVAGMTVDEAQDLSLAQIAVVLAQTWKTGELILIGDDCQGEPGDPDYKAGQAIYGWRGAFGGCLSLVARLWKELTGEDAAKLWLTVTFRHGPEICEAYRPLNALITSVHPEGHSLAWQVSLGQAWKVWLDTPEDQTSLWISRTNAPLAPLFLNTIKAHEEVSLRGGPDFPGTIDGVLYGCAGWYDDNGEFRVGWAPALAKLRANIAEEEAEDGKPDPNSMLRFVLAIAEALAQRPDLLRKANITDGKLTVGNLRRFILFFADRKARRVLSNVYRIKGDEADRVIVDDAEHFNQTWGIPEEDAACRHVALSRAKRLLLTVGQISGSCVGPAPAGEFPDADEADEE